MKKILAALTAVALVALVASCGPAVPDTTTLKGLLVKNNTDAATFAQAVDTAPDAKTLADAITAFTAASTSFVTDYKAEMDKHPEFATLSEASMPADLKQALADQAKAKDAVVAAATKLNTSPFLSDPAVTDAYQKMVAVAGTK